jgi:hypothetical protein
MEITRDLDEAEEPLTPYGVVCAVLNDDELAQEVLVALADYLDNFPIGNNQAPAIVFFDIYDAVFGVLDLWDEQDAGEVM